MPPNRSPACAGGHRDRLCALPVPQDRRHTRAVRQGGSKPVKFRLPRHSSGHNSSQKASVADGVGGGWAASRATATDVGDGCSATANKGAAIVGDGGLRAFQTGRTVTLVRWASATIAEEDGRAFAPRLTTVCTKWDTSFSSAANAGASSNAVEILAN